MEWEKLAKDIVKFRNDWNLTQVEFSKLCGIQQSIISKLEACMYKRLSEKEITNIKYIISDKCICENVINMKASKTIADIINKRLTKQHKSAIIDKFGLQKLKDLYKGKIDFFEQSDDIDFLIRISLIKYSEIRKAKDKIIKETNNFLSLSESDLNLLREYNDTIKEPFSNDYDEIKDLLKEIFNDESNDIIKSFKKKWLLEEWKNKFLS